MTDIAITQISILFIQCLLVGSLLLFLFRIRTYFGLSLLFTVLGVFQYMQVFLVSSVSIEVFPDVTVSPGSMVMFTGSLFAILLVYIREDALKTRKVIYAILAANLVLALLHFIFNWALEGKYVNQIFEIPKDFFVINARILLVGTALLILDAFLIIYLYDIITRFITSLFFRILVVMAFVLSIDTILFSIGVFAGTGHLITYLMSGLIGKLSSSVIYSLIFSLYLFYFEKGYTKHVPLSKPFKDVFSLLDYRRKFEEIHTEHEIKKEELLKKEVEYIKLFESMAQGVTYQNSSGEIIDANPAALKILGLSMDQITGKTSMDPNWRSIHENGTEFPGNEHPSMVALQTGKEVNNVVMGVFNPMNDDYRWININATPLFIKDSSEPNQVFTTFEDITQLKESAIKLQESLYFNETLLNSSLDIIYIYDLVEHVNVYSNKKITDILGYTKNEVLDFGDSVLIKLMHPDDYKTYMTDIVPRYEKATDDEVIQNMYRMKSKNGNWVWIESRESIFLRNNNGTPKQILGIATDITEKKKSQEKLRENEIRFRELSNELTLTEEKQRKEIAANIHDHLGQSLVVSKMKISDLLKTINSESNRSKLVTIKERISEAIEISRKITYDLSPPILYDLGLVETMYWMAENMEKENNIKVEFETDFESIDLSEAKLIMLYRSIQEIMYNIVKHSKANHVTVLFQNINEELSIIIQDNGKGFKLSDFEKNRSKTKSFGLFAVKERIQNLGGRFYLNSKPGKGTEVKFLLPLG